MAKRKKYCCNKHISFSFNYAASVMGTIISKLFLVYILFPSCWIIQVWQNIFSLEWVSTVRVKLTFSLSPVNLHSAM